MYEGQAGLNTIQGSLMPQRKPNITIGENLDERIMWAEKNLQELKDTKARIEATGLLTARIDDLRRAMDY